MFRLLLLVLAVLLPACSSSPVSIDYDPAAYLKTVRTYALAPPAADAAYPSLDQTRIKAAVRATLARRSVQEVAADQADVLVAFRVEQDRKRDESGVSFGLGIGSGNVGLGVGTGTPVRERVEGKLVVEVIDPVKKQVVWSATANRNLTPTMNPAERDALIGTLVSAMFERFPPP